MKREHCEREAAVLESVRAGRWPHACEDDLRAHVAQCEVCAEAVMVAEALLQEEAAARVEARLPAPGFLWWKAQIRARRLAAERAAEPINIAAQAAAACAVLSLAVLALWQWARVADWWDGLKILPAKDTLWPANVFPNLWGPYVLLVGATLLGLALVSFLLYLVFARD